MNVRTVSPLSMALLPTFMFWCLVKSLVKATHRSCVTGNLPGYGRLVDRCCVSNYSVLADGSSLEIMIIGATVMSSTH